MKHRLITPGKSLRSAFVLLGVLLSANLFASTSLILDAVEPGQNLVTGHFIDGGSFTRVFDPASGTNPGADRGQTFTTPDIAGSGASWEINEIAIVADEARDFSSLPSAALTLWVFPWNGADANDLSAWVGGDGVGDPEGPFDGTGIATFLVEAEPLPANLSVAAGAFLHFRFSPPLLMNENAAYGFLLSFDDGAAAGENLQLQQSRDTTAPVGESYPVGVVLAPQPATHTNGSQQNDDLRFYVVGTPLADPDGDGDGLPDAWEIAHFGDLAQTAGGDYDNDGLTNLAELNAGTNPADFDTDDDMLRDGAETATGIFVDANDTGTSATLADSDGDGAPDGLEVARGLDPTDPASRLDRPNIIFILVDDMGWGDLGVFYQNQIVGTKKHATPQLDTLAGEGMQFRAHYCPAPVCAPSRASLLLGVHQGHANVRDNSFDKALADNHNLATVLKTAGYATALIGKWGLQGNGDSPASWPAYPTKRGFDYFFGYVRHGDGHTRYPAHVTASRGLKEVWENDRMIRDDLALCYTTDLFTARAKQHLVDQTAANPNQPFFLLLAYDAPHAALQLPTQAYPAGGGLSGGVQWSGTPGAAINTASGTIDSWRHPDYTGRGWTDVEERFATMVRRVDDGVGDLVQTLKDLGIDDNTLIVFTSDNGPHHESYLAASYEANSFDSFGPFDGTKRDTWEGGIRMPTWVRWRGATLGGQINQAASQFQDWLPTFSELAGFPAPCRADGVSLVPTLTGSGQQKESLIYVEYQHTGTTKNYAEFDPSHRGRRRNQMQVIHAGGYKGVRYNIQSHADDFEIYDLERDPQEVDDLAGTAPEFDALQQRMKDRVLEVRMADPAYNRPYDGALVNPVETSAALGVAYAAYEGLWPWVPEFTALTPVRRGVVETFDLSALTRSSDAGLLFTGYFAVPTSGTWTFQLASDAGAHLRLHDAQVIDDDYNHTGAELSGSIGLAAGLHPFRLYYRTRGGTAPALSLQWSGPGVSKQPVPASALFRHPSATNSPTPARHWFLYGA